MYKITYTVQEEVHTYLSTLILFKYASKEYSNDVGVTGTGDITTVSMNGDDAGKAKKVTQD